MNEKEKIKANLTLCMSDLHFGHESCLYNTFWYTLDKMISELKLIKEGYDFKNIFIILNGDMVSGTMIYRNQYLESQVQKNESIIMFGAYLLHLVIEKIESELEQHVKVFIVAGNHETGRSPLPHNFSIGLSRRLSTYNHNVRYTSYYLILNMANELFKFQEENYEIKLKDYNILAFHGWGGADYSSASPSMIREMTRIHSQFSTNKGIIIQRFLVGHTHWIETGRTVLGIKFDVCGGFMRWSKKVSSRESGMLYYIYDETEDFQVKAISGLKQQLAEEEDQGLHIANLKYVAETMEDAIDFEIDLGLLQERDEWEEKR